MASLNQCNFIGNLGRDPEMRYMPSGDAVASFSIACTENWKDKNGQKQERTEWVRVSMFGKQAEVAGEYLKKGSSVFISGRMQTREWEDKDGNKRHTTEIVADTMRMLGSRPAADGQQQDRPAGTGDAPAQRPAGKPASKPAGGGGSDDFEDDIPF
jgi:single-strand DNA-binding protein